MTAPPDIFPCKLEVRSRGEVKPFKVLRVLCDGGRYLNCWELRYLYDASEMYGSGTQLCHWASRRAESWRNMHQKLWPACACPDLLQAGGDKRRKRGCAELAPYFPHLAACTSLFMSIMVWSVYETRRTHEHRLWSAELLADFTNELFRDNPLLPPAIDLRVTDGCGNLALLRVSHGGLCDADTVLRGFAEQGTVFRTRWVAQLQSAAAGPGFSANWLRHLPDRCQVGELLVACLLQPQEMGKLVQMGLDIARQVAGLLDHYLEGKLKGWAAENVPVLLAPSGNPRRVDPHYKQLTASAEEPREQLRRSKVARRAEKEATLATQRSKVQYTCTVKHGATDAQGHVLTVLTCNANDKRRAMQHDGDQSKSVCCGVSWV